ncbi:MAG: hypothetical protein ACRDXB_20900 [Actinomycetes bacterium]
MENGSDILMLSGIAQVCPDCGDEAIFVPVDEETPDHGEFCCTSCDAALVLLPALESAGAASRVA